MFVMGSFRLPVADGSLKFEISISIAKMLRMNCFFAENDSLINFNNEQMK